MRGGRRPGAGRPVGAQNRRTAEQVAAVAAGGITPLDYLLSVMRNEENDTPTRVDAAHKAAPFVHARLSSVEAAVTVDPGDPIAELMEQVASHGRRIGQTT